MEQTFLTLLAFLPFVLVFLLLIVFRIPAVKTMPIVFFLTLIGALFVWKVGSAWIFASILKGILTTFEIMLLVFFAVFLMQIFVRKKKVLVVESILTYISPDARIQGILIAFFLGALIEGVSGFGTPQAITAPLLFSLGFPAVLSVVLAMISNSVPVSFGAAGTPILFGLGSLGFKDEVIKEVIGNVVFMHSVAGIIIPFAIVYFIVQASRHKSNRLRLILECAPFILFSWIVFVIPYFFAGKFIGAELPSILAGLVSLIFVSFTARHGLFVPKNIIHFKPRENVKKFSRGEKIKAVLPYVLLISILFLSRAIPFVKTTAQYPKISFLRIFVTDVSFSFMPFYTPSFFFLISALFSIFLFRVKKKEVYLCFRDSFKKIKFVFISLLFTLSFVQLLIVFDKNFSGYPGIIKIFADSFVGFGEFYVFVAPFLGVIGAFIAGSNTVSNLLFAPIQAQAAGYLSLDLAVILGLQVVGGAIGNMIAIHNILAASSTVGLHHEESKVIRKTIIVAVIYSLIAGFLAFLMLK